MHGTHDSTLILLSFIIAFLASFSGLDTVRRVFLSAGRRKLFWLTGGSLAMGLGIWAMHFIAMLAFQLPVLIHYDFYLVSLSVIIAIAASFWCLSLISLSEANLVRLFTGGIILGIGISGMHLVGMAAIKELFIHYQMLPLTFSISFSIVVSSIALLLAFRSSESGKRIRNSAKVISSVVMAMAIVGTHYTAMTATTFTGYRPFQVGAYMLNSQTIVIPVTIGALIILGVFLVISFISDQKWEDEITFKGAILESVLDCVIIIDQYGEIMECNPAVKTVFGYAREEMIGQQLEKTLLLPSSMKNGEQTFTFKAIEGKMICDERLEVTGVRQDRSTIPLELTVTKIKKAGSSLYTIYARDITPLKQTEENIRQLAYHDTLTGLPNRRFFEESLRRSLEEAKKGHAEVAVLFLDLDHFKKINDSMGHSIGDLLLKSVAERLKQCLDQKHFVARNGGDEFTIILNNTSEQKAENIVKQVIDCITSPFHLEGQTIEITTSIGVALFPKDASDEETLVKYADMAMYETKKRGKNNYTFYHHSAGSSSS
ncbi:diguanylate cyclase [Sporosarcina sp. ACRSM]|uniref:sensor domain-containing diguanylate cyclase n=1 Tax=Sporosarcina sp. ACRSM TaxID=2918216 RepID=UPI001EF70C51|nr:diguanylate cyclase [Sporosarcina sp. ACRSM]MCG7335882.1 diguanylate cyclase [Sporosarcina sp. ACRSM]